MADNSKTITELMTDAAATLKAIKDTAGADREARRKAFEAYEDVLLLIGRHAVGSFEGRTALLTGLIAELTEFNKTIQVANPIAAHVDNLTAIADKAMGLFKDEKKSAAADGQSG